MTSAEKWAEYQTEYIRYGFDMRPLDKKVEEPKARPKAIGIKQRVQSFVLVILCGFIFIGLIGLNAFSSKLQYDINTLNKEILSVERVVQNLEVDIKTATNITTVESKALSIGMVYPTFEEMIYLDSHTGVLEDFALALRESAYE
ncbi:MAG: hypothetical protein EOM59_01035 [Clostridia bacterium]|nr:hypothetical protein [Clostridia bacterium]